MMYKFKNWSKPEKCNFKSKIKGKFRSLIRFEWRMILIKGCWQTVLKSNQLSWDWHDDITDFNASVNSNFDAEVIDFYRERHKVFMTFFIPTSLISRQLRIMKDKIFSWLHHCLQDFNPEWQRVFMTFFCQTTLISRLIVKNDKVFIKRYWKRRHWFQDYNHKVLWCMRSYDNVTDLKT